MACHEMGEYLRKCVCLSAGSSVQSTHLINTDKGNNRGLLKPVELCFLSHVSSKTRLCQGDGSF